MFQTEHKFYVQYLFSENCVFYKIMWGKKGKTREATD